MIRKFLKGTHSIVQYLPIDYLQLYLQLYIQLFLSTAPFAMDQHAETTFLLEIEKRKSLISFKNYLQLYIQLFLSTAPFAMDQHAETTFLLEIEKRKSLISSKNNSRKARDRKNAAWTDIKSALLLKCGKDFDRSAPEEVVEPSREGQEQATPAQPDRRWYLCRTWSPELGPLLIFSPRPHQSGLHLALEPL